MDRNELVSGLREGLQTKSYMNDATMPITNMVEFIDKNIHDYGRSIQGKCDNLATGFVTTSKVSKTQISIGELIAWCDFHLNYTVQDVIRHEAQIATAYYQTICDKRSGCVYLYKPGDRPVFRWIRNWDEYHFLFSSRLVPPADAIIQAEGNLVDFLYKELVDMAADKSKLEPVQPPPPPKTYTVVAGDTLGKIAAKFGVSIADLVKWNGIANPDDLKVDQVLKLEPGKG